MQDAVPMRRAGRLPVARSARPVPHELVRVPNNVPALLFIPYRINIINSECLPLRPHAPAAA